MIRHRSWLLVSWLFAALAAALALPALGESAEITGDCRFTATVNASLAPRVGTDNYATSWNGTGGSLTVTLPAGATARGIQLCFLKDAVPVSVEALGADGAVTARADYRDRYLNAWIDLPSTSAYRISTVSPDEPISLGRVRVFTGDGLPADAQTWREPEGPVDLLQIVAHPDDELVWFGGLLPTYAGERGLNVLVAYAAVRGPMKSGRFNELLDGLWTCGVTAYPVFGPFSDFHVKSVRAVIKRWGEGVAQAWCTGLIRQFRPRVVVTHDIRGESGHAQHQTVSQAVIDAVTELSGDPAFDPDSAALYGVHTPQKLYIHRYRNNEIFMGWDEPLSRFGGKTSAEVARDAFRKHVSQRGTHYHIYLTGPLDSRYLGLYFTAVGPDEAGNDLFEHVHMAGDGEI